MAATLYSLSAFKVARAKEGLGAREAARFARHVATELAEDGELEVREAEPVAPVVPAAAAEGHTRENPHPQVADIGAPYGYAVGSKYDRRLDVADIAKLVRQDIAEAVKAGKLPKGLKTSVRIRRFSGGRAIDVFITGMSGPLLNVERVIHEKNNPHDYRRHDELPRYSPEASHAMKVLGAILGAYNYDRSEASVDYFDVNFYADVAVHWEYEKAVKDAILAEVAAQ